jgi:hypothetical protein
MAEQEIEPFAELMARLDEPFADRAGILQAAGLDDGGFQRMADRWSKELRNEGAEVLAQRYGDAYEASARELANARRGERVAPDLRFLNADVQSFRDEAAAVPLQAFAESAPAAPPPAPVHAPRLAITPMTAVAPPIAAPPMFGAAPPIAPPPMLPASEPAPSRESPWMPEGMRRFKDIHGTQLVTDAPKRPALPFDPTARPTIPAHSDFGDNPTPHANLVPEGMRGFTDVHGTQVASTTPKRPALPFEPSRSAAPAPLPSDVGETHALSLEQYASLCVDLSVDPAKRQEVLDRYRMSEDQQRRVNAHWQARIAADSRVQLALDQACATYRAWLRSAR